MAVFTSVSAEVAAEVARAHGLPAQVAVEPIAAGSVNSNFFLSWPDRRCFMRIYEEQEVDGVRYEWALLEHLRAAGVPVPTLLRRPDGSGPAPGEVRVDGKPVALFSLVGGEMSCQKAVSTVRAHGVGRALGRCHRATDDFAERRPSRFALHHLPARLDRAESHGEADLSTPIAKLRQVVADLERALKAAEPRLNQGVIHGDLFRDNVHFAGDEVEALIDWESASDGLRVFDLAVTLCAFTYGSEFEWSLAAALVAGYREAYTLGAEDWAFLPTAMRMACARFTVTRITDFRLRPSDRHGVHKDYRRFLGRLEALDSLTPDGLRRHLGL